jgi:hypothetical protein
MKKALALSVLIASLFAEASFATAFKEEPFAPFSPDVLGRGGSILSDVSGYNSFFYNPAGFSRENGSVTLGSAESWIISRPDLLLGLGQKIIGGTAVVPGDIVNFMSGQVTTGGIGVGGSAGIGYVGNGLGLGAVLIVNSLLSGPTLLGMNGDLTATLGFLGGLSVPFDVLGMKIHVGGSVRPMIRIHVPVSGAVAFNMLYAVATSADVFTALSSANALYGVGIGLDAGAIAEWGWFTFGLSIRDLAGTQFRYTSNSFGTLWGTLSTQLEFPAAGTLVTSDTYTIPMDIGAGIALHPDLGTFNNILDPSLSIDLRNVVGALDGSASIWTLLHAGAELKILSLFTLRGGLNQGYLTVGAGVKLLFLDFNFALFTNELGAYIGDKPSAGATLEAAIRW